jgi:hypothetical protein
MSYSRVLAATALASLLGFAGPALAGGAGESGAATKATQPKTGMEHQTDMMPQKGYEGRSGATDMQKKMNKDMQKEMPQVKTPAGGDSTPKPAESTNR